MIKITDRNNFIERCFNASRCSARGAELWTWVNEMIDSMTESGREEDGLMSRLEGFACDDLSADAYALYDELRRA